MKNIFKYKGFTYEKKYGHITIREENISCKDEYEFIIKIDNWLKTHGMNQKERNNYRGSKEWKNLAIKVKINSGYRCSICGIYKKKGLNIHHALESKSYGKEEFNDLIPLCSTCHKQVSWILSKTKNKIDLNKYCNNLKKVIKKSNY